MIYLNVNGRIRDAVAKVCRTAAASWRTIHSIGPHGFRAIVLDSEGNRMALHSETRCVGEGDRSNEGRVDATQQTVSAQLDLVLYQRHRAPRAVRPEIAEDAPAALAAGVAAAGDLPLLAHLGVAPGAVAHERHQVLAIALARCGNGPRSGGRCTGVRRRPRSRGRSTRGSSASRASCRGCSAGSRRETWFRRGTPLRPMPHHGQACMDSETGPSQRPHLKCVSSCRPNCRRNCCWRISFQCRSWSVAWSSCGDAAREYRSTFGFARR